MFTENIRIAYNNCVANKLRSCITITIIALGIFALIVINTVLDSAKQSLVDSFVLTGENSFEITANLDREEYKNINYKPINEFEAYRFKEQFNFAGRISICMSADSRYNKIKFNEKETEPNIAIMGIDENYFPINNITIEQGTNFTENNINNQQPICILGAQLAKDIFGKSLKNVIGQHIRINNNYFTIYAILAEKPEASFGKSYDDMAFIPLPILKQIQNNNKTHKILVQISDEKLYNAAVQEAEALFNQLRLIEPGKLKNYKIIRSDESIAQISKSLRYIKLATWAIVLITLMSSGVGLMNTMLVGVTENYKQIGLQKAIGAKSKTILQQVLTESVLLSICGALLGIILGIIVGNLIAYFLKTSIIIPWLWMTVGIIVCLLVGLLSGYVPAKKAAALNPVVALRSE